MHNQTAILFFYKGKKMKLLSFAIPCYNSKDYMEHCIESILPARDDVLDDGESGLRSEPAPVVVVALSGGDGLAGGAPR